MAAGLQIKTATGDRSLAALKAIDGGGVDRALTELRVIGPDGVDRVIFASLGGGGAITVDPTAVHGAKSSSTFVNVTTRTTTVTVTGGVAPYTYAWSKVSGDDLVITSPTGATTAFTSSVGPGVSLSGVYKCTVTDAAGTVADSPNVTATVINLGGTL